jgi:hypothetical protein
MRLAQDELEADPDLAAALLHADANPIAEHLGGKDGAGVGDHEHVPASGASDGDGDDHDRVTDADNDEDEDLRNLSMSECVPTTLGWSHSEMYEGLFDPAREAISAYLR